MNVWQTRIGFLLSSVNPCKLKLMQLFSHNLCVVNRCELRRRADGKVQQDIALGPQEGKMIIEEYNKNSKHKYTLQHSK